MSDKLPKSIFGVPIVSQDDSLGLGRVKVTNSPISDVIERIEAINQRETTVIAFDFSSYDRFYVTCERILREALDEAFRDSLDNFGENE